MKKLLNIAILFGVVAVIGGAITVHYKGKGVTVIVPKAGIKIEIEKLVSEMENRLRDAETKVADFEDYVSGIQARSVKRSQGIRNLDTQIGKYDRLIAGYESELTYVKFRVGKGEVVRTATANPRVLSPDELMVFVEQKKVQIRTARQGKDQLEAERAFLREELKKDEIELHTAPLQLLELQGSLANLRLLRDLHKDRLAVIDDFRAPDAETLYADARGVLDVAFSGFDRQIGSVGTIRVDMSDFHTDDLLDKHDVIVRNIDEALGIASEPETIATLIVDVK